MVTLLDLLGCYTINTQHLFNTLKHAENCRFHAGLAQKHAPVHKSN